MKLITLAALFLPTAIAVPVNPGVEDGLAKRDIALTDYLVYTAPLDVFLERQAARNPPRLDWESTYCPGSDGIQPKTIVSKLTIPCMKIPRVL